MNFQVDLTNCDREPIHIPGKIQSHGFLVAVNASTYVISYISTNIEQYADVVPQHMLGKHITELEPYLELSADNAQLTQILNLAKNSKSDEIINPLTIHTKGKGYNVIIGRSKTELIMEFETTDSDLDLDVQKTIGRSVAEILSGKTLIVLLQKAAFEVKKIINYDRVMIYKFNDDGHGEVVAEVKNDDLEPFLGLHYPASDIPKQARELYKLNLTRIIADVNAESSPIITYQEADVPLDLTHSVLRAVSPIHIQYLKNMGVGSSFSISLIAHGELWGLIACHNYSPRFIDYKARDASKLIGQILSSALEYRQDEENNEQVAAINEAASTIADYIKKDIDIVFALTKNKTTIRDVTMAAGVALIFDGGITTLGNTPDDDQIKEIAGWLKVNMVDNIYYTHRFPEIFAAAKKYSNVASGILACVLSKELAEMIIWFKPEQITSINWAGNPEKPVEQTEDGLLQLSPRKSFEIWNQIVQNTSAKWKNDELATVLKVREDIIYAINRKANEIRLLNEKLQVAYDELDTFSYTISHDLRTPLSSIKNYSELLLATNKSLDESAKKMLERIIKGTDKMHMLIKEILHYSRVGRTDLEINPIDMSLLLNEIKREVLSAINSPNLEFIMGDTPPINGDVVMISQVFTNLISNAVKYSSKSQPAIVKIEGKVGSNEVTYSVSDNGVGIDVNYYNRVFELFKRMDNALDFEGTGVGLAIVKRIIEKHHARIWFESKLEVGTIFYVSFKN
ncbi:ATP-binding protein [Mucilaginibacter ginsenosidivorax]|uniref:histidine kinase n=1 Tax=Mucilaginibacter ginsenosidivorax TaxID=862126 RepID=A0A5B8VXT9_9SPHI|nr:ATP-binding protein [Mucilaginibacter ginsenosidivorax]QEC76400.1 GAF domain-containing protein [Mucilaginibacter ginsenosidivorax]